ncbi:hypothetical protein ACQEU6_25430 [Spirillospora sp. CA-108201]
MSVLRRPALSVLAGALAAAALSLGLQPPASAAGPRVDLRVLVVTDGGASVSAVADRLKAEGGGARRLREAVRDPPARLPAACVKVAPGIPHEAVPDDAEAEWVSVGGDVKEAALWLGGLPAVLNVGSGRATPLRDLAAQLVRVTGARSRVLEAAAGSERSAGPERSAGVAWQRADIRAAGRALGWAPVTDLTTSLRDLWAAQR